MYKNINNTRNRHRFQNLGIGVYVFTILKWQTCDDVKRCTEQYSYNNLFEMGKFELIDNLTNHII